MGEKATRDKDVFFFSSGYSRPNGQGEKMEININRDPRRPPTVCHRQCEARARSGPLFEQGSPASVRKNNRVFNTQHLQRWNMRPERKVSTVCRGGREREALEEENWQLKGALNRSMGDNRRGRVMYARIQEELRRMDHKMMTLLADRHIPGVSDTMLDVRRDVAKDTMVRRLVQQKRALQRKLDEREKELVSLKRTQQFSVLEEMTMTMREYYLESQRLQDILAATKCSCTTPASTGVSYHQACMEDTKPWTMHTISPSDEAHTMAKNDEISSTIDTVRSVFKDHSRCPHREQCESGDAKNEEWCSIEHAMARSPMQDLPSPENYTSSAYKETVSDDKALEGHHYLSLKDVIQVQQNKIKALQHRVNALEISSILRTKKLTASGCRPHGPDNLNGSSRSNNTKRARPSSAGCRRFPHGCAKVSTRQFRGKSQKQVKVQQQQHKHQQCTTEQGLTWLHGPKERSCFPGSRPSSAPLHRESEVKDKSNLHQNNSGWVSHTEFPTVNTRASGPCSHRERELEEVVSHAVAGRTIVQNVQKKLTTNPVKDDTLNSTKLAVGSMEDAIEGAYCEMLADKEGRASQSSNINPVEQTSSPIEPGQELCNSGANSPIGDNVDSGDSGGSFIHQSGGEGSKEEGNKVLMSGGECVETVEWLTAGSNPASDQSAAHTSTLMSRSYNNSALLRASFVEGSNNKCSGQYSSQDGKADKVYTTLTVSNDGYNSPSTSKLYTKPSGDREGRGSEGSDASDLLSRPSIQGEGVGDEGSGCSRGVSPRDLRDNNEAVGWESHTGTTECSPGMVLTDTLLNQEEEEENSKFGQLSTPSPTLGVVCEETTQSIGSREPIKQLLEVKMKELKGVEHAPVDNSPVPILSVDDREKNNEIVDQDAIDGVPSLDRDEYEDDFDEYPAFE